MHLPDERTIEAEALRLGLATEGEALSTRQRAAVVSALIEQQQQKPAATAPEPRLINRTATPAFDGQLVVEVWHVPNTKENRTDV